MLHARQVGCIMQKEPGNHFKMTERIARELASITIEMNEPSRVGLKWVKTLNILA